MRRFAPIAILVGSALLNATSASAITHAGATVLHYPISARIRALGDNGVADNSDPANIFFNPANIVAAPRAYLQGSRWEYDLGDFGIDDDIWTAGANAGVAFVTGGGTTLAADISYGRLDYGESVARLPNGTPVGEFDTYEESLALTVGLGAMVGDNSEIRVGAAIKRWSAHYAPPDVSSDPEEITPDALAFDAGVTFALHRRYAEWSVVPAIAAAIVNTGSDIEFDDGNEDPLPTRFHFGANVIVESPPVRLLGANVPLFAFTCNVDGTEPFHEDPFLWGMGTELAVAQVLFLRNGFHSHPDDKEYDELGYDDGSGWGVGLGVPAGSFRFRFDYGHTSVFSVPDIYGVSLIWRM